MTRRQTARFNRKIVRSVWIALPVLSQSLFWLAMTAPIASAKVEDDTIVLGAALSLSGKYGTLGLIAKNGYDLAVGTINRKGGVTVRGKPYKLKIQYYDDRSNKKLGAELAERLIVRDKIKFLLGPYSSALTEAVASVTEKYKIPMIEANGASPSIFSKGRRYVFGVLSSSDQYLSGVIDLAVTMAKKAGRNPQEMTLAVVVENDPFSLDVRKGAIERAEALKIKISVDERFPTDFENSWDIFQKIKNRKPSILIASGHSKGAAATTLHLQKLKINIPMIGVTHCEAGRLTEKFGAAAEGILCATQWAESLKYKGAVFRNARSFSRQYLKKFKGHRTTPYQAAESAAAVLVWKDAFERANSFDTERLRDAIAATNLKTMFGRIRFAPTGQNVAKPMVLRQIQKGRYRVVAPIEWAAWPLIYPRTAPE